MAHRNAPLTPQGRLLLCRRIEAGTPVAHVAAAMGISRRCASKCLMVQFDSSASRVARYHRVGRPPLALLRTTTASRPRPAAGPNEVGAGPDEGSRAAGTNRGCLVHSPPTRCTSGNTDDWCHPCASGLARRPRMSPSLTGGRRCGRPSAAPSSSWPPTLAALRTAPPPQQLRRTVGRAAGAAPGWSAADATQALSPRRGELPRTLVAG